MNANSFDQLAAEAAAQDFSGWDFSWTHGRWHEANPSWDYRHLVQERINTANSLLDMGTGGGEFLASLENLPQQSYATESYPPNIPIARDRLEPLGIQVLALESDRALPLPDSALQLIINRHESYWVPELQRVLRSGGVFLTQQVGALDNIQINKFLGAPVEAAPEVWTLQNEVYQLKQAGFQILRAEEQFLDSVFDDIGVVVFYLKIISWQIPDFSLDKYRARLLAMHRLIENKGPFVSKAHRFLIEAQKR